MREDETLSEDLEDGQSGLIALLAGIGVGVVLGGAIALLSAPQSGQATRSQLRETADDTLARLRTSMEDLKSKVDELATSARSHLPGSQSAEGAASLEPDGGEFSPAG
jgi:gas vesicle protein